MSNLSTLLSGKSVHPDDRCLTTLGSFGARVLRGTSLRCSWDPLTLHQHEQWLVNTSGLVGTQAPQPRAVTRSAKRLSPCPGDLRGSVRQDVIMAPKWRLSGSVLSVHTCL